MIKRINQYSYKCSFANLVHLVDQAHPYDHRYRCSHQCQKAHEALLLLAYPAFLVHHDDRAPLVHPEYSIECLSISRYVYGQMRNYEIRLHTLSPFSPYAPCSPYSPKSPIRPGGPEIRSFFQ